MPLSLLAATLIANAGATTLPALEGVVLEGGSISTEALPKQNAQTWSLEKGAKMTDRSLVLACEHLFVAYSGPEKVFMVSGENGCTLKDTARFIREKSIALMRFEGKWVILSGREKSHRTDGQPVETK